MQTLSKLYNSQRSYNSKTVNIWRTHTNRSLEGTTKTRNISHLAFTNFLKTKKWGDGPVFFFFANLLKTKKSARWLSLFFFDNLLKTKRWGDGSVSLFLANFLKTKKWLDGLVSFFHLDNLTWANLAPTI